MHILYTPSTDLWFYSRSNRKRVNKFQWIIALVRLTIVLSKSTDRYTLYCSIVGQTWVAYDVREQYRLGQMAKGAAV